MEKVFHEESCLRSQNPKCSTNLVELTDSHPHEALLRPGVPSRSHRVFVGRSAVQRFSPFPRIPSLGLIAAELIWAGNPRWCQISETPGSPKVSARSDKRD